MCSGVLCYEVIIGLDDGFTPNGWQAIFQKVIAQVIDA